MRTADLFATSDDEQQEPSFEIPRLWPPATPGTGQPPLGARCSNCSGQAWWVEKSGRQWGHRCCICIPSPRPDDQIVVVDTSSFGEVLSLPQAE